MSQVQTAISGFAHVEWLDLYNDGTLVECAVIKKDPIGNVFFFELNKLDAIDKQRIFNIITKRHAGQFELWDLLSQHTLGNGMNALNYFHQLVKVLTPGGKIMDPRQGVVGVGRAGVVKTGTAK